MRTCLAAALALLCSLPAFAAVGRVTSLEGHATRTPAGGQAEPLSLDSTVDEKDTVDVQDGALEITLDDNSVLALSEGSELQITQAVFQPEQRTFLGFLKLGSLWTSVRKTVEGEQSRFEVTTEHAVAGVRGTVFRMDVTGAQEGGNDTVVSVEEGQVQVAERPDAAAQTPGTPFQPRSELLGANRALRVGHRRWIAMAFAHPNGRFAQFIARRRANAQRLRFSHPNWWRRHEEKQHLRQRLKLRRERRLMP